MMKCQGGGPGRSVVLVDRARRGGAAKNRSGGFEFSSTLRVFDLMACGR
jgi:hypothetical protein